MPAGKEAKQWLTQYLHLRVDKTKQTTTTTLMAVTSQCTLQGLNSFTLQGLNSFTLKQPTCRPQGAQHVVGLQRNLLYQTCNCFRRSDARWIQLLVVAAYSQQRPFHGAVPCLCAVALSRCGRLRIISDDQCRSLEG
jgi:hypothetical protein